MAFTVEDFPDLIRLSEQRPDWRAELCRLLLPQELLELPAVVRRLAEAQEPDRMGIAAVGGGSDRPHR